MKLQQHCGVLSLCLKAKQPLISAYLKPFTLATNNTERQKKNKPALQLHDLNHGQLCNENANL